MAKMARPARRTAGGSRLLGVCAAAAVVSWGHSAFTAAPRAAPAPAVQLRATSPQQQVANPVKTVSETVADFYKAYPAPPVLPMYRTFLVDAMTSTHLALVDSRFKYDAVFALGLQEYFNGLMGTYDKMVASEETAKIWRAYCSALGLDAEKVSADAAAASAFASGTAPAQILAAMEGSEPAAEKPLADAFAGIGSGLYTMPFSVGLFKMMQLSGVELSTANAEEWAKALKVTPSKATRDLDTYRLNQDKLQKAEEMMREIEIREKKKLAQQLEEKAKALAAKAAGKTEEDKEPAMA